MDKHNRNGIGVDRAVSVAALLAGLLALAFSWDANRIAQHANEISLVQVQAKVVPLFVEYVSGTSFVKEDGRRWVACANSFRVANISGAATDIVEQQAVVFFGNEQFSVGSTHARATLYRRLPGSVTSLEVVYVDSGVTKGWSQSSLSEESIGIDKEVTFPVQVNAFSTVALFPRISLLVESSRSVWNSMKGNPQHLSYDPAAIEGHMPVDVVFNLKTATGQTVSSPRTNCFYLK